MEGLLKQVRLNLLEQLASSNDAVYDQRLRGSLDLLKILMEELPTQGETMVADPEEAEAEEVEGFDFMESDEWELTTSATSVGGTTTSSSM